MTTNEAILKLQLLLDKTGSPYFTTDEYLIFLNMAQLEFLNRLSPDSLGGVLNFEIDQNTIQNLQGLIFTVSISLNGAGAIAYSAINSAVQTLSFDSSCTMFRILSIKDESNENIVKFVKNNNLWSNRNNSFKRPSIGNYQYTHDSFGIYFYPTIPGGGPVFKITVLKSPKIMTINNSPDFDDYVMNQIIQVAYQMATVATRDENGLQLGTNTTVQSK